LGAGFAAYDLRFGLRAAQPLGQIGGGEGDGDAPGNAITANRGVQALGSGQKRSGLGIYRSLTPGAKGVEHVASGGGFKVAPKVFGSLVEKLTGLAAGELGGDRLAQVCSTYGKI